MNQFSKVKKVFYHILALNDHLIHIKSGKPYWYKLLLNGIVLYKAIFFMSEIPNTRTRTTIYTGQ